VQRGDVFEAMLDPVEGSEQGGRRPVLIVSRNVINQVSPVVIVVPISKRANFTRIYPSQTVVGAGTGGLSIESVAMAEQVRTISKTRLTRILGHFPDAAMSEINAKLKLALDLQ
jgi:mRNA interferase MazF